MSDSILLPATKDLGGGFTVRRLLPAAARQAVGPFLFFDHFGPITATADSDHDVRPHPHIGLATVTYLLEGAMQHSDSTGAVQRIEPGAINWMTAGCGIVHSERTPADQRAITRRLHGLQMWCALPEADEELAPSFVHTPASVIPALDVGGADVRVLVGSAFGVSSPVATRSPTLLLDIRLHDSAAFPLPPAAERAVYSVDHPFQLDGQNIEPFTMVVIPPGDEPMISAEGDATVALIGGEPLGRRHLYWNFVSSRKERIVQAADDWEAGRFAKVPGDDQFIPLPQRRPG
jgi:redox-sensitive bicupin YhaK (pirin superfamily)